MGAGVEVGAGVLSHRLRFLIGLGGFWVGMEGVASQVWVVLEAAGVAIGVALMEVEVVIGVSSHRRRLVVVEEVASHP